MTSDRILSFVYISFPSVSHIKEDMKKSGWIVLVSSAMTKTAMSVSVSLSLLILTAAAILLFLFHQKGKNSIHRCGHRCNILHSIPTHQPILVSVSFQTKPKKTFFIPPID